MTNFTAGNKFQKYLGDLLWNFFFTITAIFLNGYRYGMGDLEEHLPQVFKKLNPKLYPYDYFTVPATTRFTIREIYVNTISFFSHLFPVATVCFAFYLICTFCIVAYTRKITAFFFKDPYSAYISPVLLLIFLHSWTVGGNEILDYELTCSVFSSAFCVAAFYYFLREKYFTAGVLIGFATLYQLLQGLQFYGIIVLLIALLPTSKKWQSVGKISTGYLLAGAYMLIPIFYRQFFMPHANADMPRFYQILTGIYSGHYKASAFPLKNYLQSISLIVVTLGLLAVTRNEKFRLFATLFGIIVGGCVVYYCTTELFHWNTIYKLQWFKTTIWISFFASVIIAGYAGKLLSGFLKINPYQPVVLILLFGVVIWQSLFVYSVPGIIRKSWAGKYMVGPYYPKSDLTRMHEWINQNTPADAIILSMPFDVAILCETKRSTPTGSRAIIHEPDFILNWYDRFAKIYAIDTCSENTPYLQRLIQAAPNYRQETNKELAPKCQYDYRIANIGTPGCAGDTLNIVHTEGNYALIKNNLH
ncbi:DUF6798 domain-containing protein [Taibaiella soli]|uniref:DUF6798 domain-containing protein n=1 Tax=Taibaiella soli TaxID=1649169 RepID=A0A2W2BWX2_9BACT|nr:DUF6798 domain-containing protein [Taibaiella soli]PZF72353.1 hypothetical protein DN068_13445 [Taibaiella soli]